MSQAKIRRKRRWKQRKARERNLYAWIIKSVEAMKIASLLPPIIEINGEFYKFDTAKYIGSPGHIVRRALVTEGVR